MNISHLSMIFLSCLLLLSSWETEKECTSDEWKKVSQILSSPDDWFLFLPLQKQRRKMRRHKTGILIDEELRKESDIFSVWFFVFSCCIIIWAKSEKWLLDFPKKSQGEEEEELNPYNLSSEWSPRKDNTRMILQPRSGLPLSVTFLEWLTG